MRHIPVETLFAYLDKAVTETKEKRLIAHFHTCKYCRQELKLAYLIVDTLDNMAGKPLGV